MANQDLQDSAVVVSSIGGSDVIYLMQVTKDGSSTLGGNDILGNAAATVYKLPYKRTSDLTHTNPYSVVVNEANKQVGLIEGQQNIQVAGTFLGGTLNLFKIIKTPGIYWRMGLYIPENAGYLKLYFHLGKFDFAGPITFAAGEVQEWQFVYTPYELDSATTDTAGVGGKVYTMTNPASITAIASATDV